MAEESYQHKLDRTRKPRVQITVDLEKGDEEPGKELPFVVGVMSDLSGARAEPLEELKKREFTPVSRDNFNEFLSKQEPRFNAKVDSKLGETDQSDDLLSVDITFKSMSDFEPEAIVKKVPVLAELLEIRRRLKSLQGRVTSNTEVEELVRDIIAKEDRRREIADELGREKLDQGSTSSAGSDTKGGK